MAKLIMIKLITSSIIKSDENINSKFITQTLGLTYIIKK